MARNRTSSTLLIAAGGTGGHITPGVSIAEAWVEGGGSVLFATLKKNLEYPDIVNLARLEGVSVVATDAPKLTFHPIRFFSFLRDSLRAYRLIRFAAHEEKVTAVLGMGGFSSFPAVLYSIFNRVPLFLCEQNARWGLVTRAMRFFARRIFLSFPPITTTKEKFIVTGNPLRAIFAQATPKPTPKPNKKSSRGKRTNPTRKKTIFFVGGSQGAKDINRLYEALIHTPDAKKYSIILSTGPQQFEEILRVARKTDDVRKFVSDMPQTLLAADLVVARAGSGTLFEILWSGKPALLLPYPFAADDHQRANAEAYSKMADATVCDVRPFNAEKALAMLLSVLKTLPVAKPVGSTAVAGQITRYIKEACEKV